MRPHKAIAGALAGLSAGCASVTGPCTLDATFGTEAPGVIIACEPGGSATMLTPSRTLQIVETIERDALEVIPRRAKE